MAWLTPPTPTPDENSGPLLPSVEMLYLVPFNTRTFRCVVETLQFNDGAGGGGGTHASGYAA